MIGFRALDRCLRSFAAGLFVAALAPSLGSGQETFDQKAVVRALAAELRLRALSSSPCPPGARVHLYDSVLGAGDRVRPAFWKDNQRETLVCSSTCRLFFVDWCPTAHFQHPVAIVLWDQAPSGDGLSWLDASWWPVIEEAPEQGQPLIAKPVFDSPAARALPAARRRMRGAALEVGHGSVVLDTSPDFSVYDPTAFVDAEPARPVPVMYGETAAAGMKSTMSGGTLPGATRSAVWAVVVDGDGKISDTFDEDAAGIYAVLRGHLIPEDQIYLLSPHLEGPEPCLLPDENTVENPPCPDLAGCTPPGPDEYNQRTSYCRLRNIFLKYLPSRIASARVPCEELFFFFGSHGGDGHLNCVASKSFGSQIGTKQLNRWLATVPCTKATVVIESCGSGAFIRGLRSPPAFNSGQQRMIFTSTSENGLSHGDIDSRYDPNPGDVGSETIWGYIEAFGTGSADRKNRSGIRDRRISFAEAVAYAKANDATILDPEYENQPLVYPDPAPDVIPHSSYPPGFKVDANISGLGQGQQSPGDPLGRVHPIELTTGRPLVLEVRNAGPSPLDVATVRLFLGNASRAVVKTVVPDGLLRDVGVRPEARDEPWWPAGFSQIGDTVLLAALAPGESRRVMFRSRQLPEILGEDDVIVLATVDGPKDPVITFRCPVKGFLSMDDNATGAVIDLVR